MPQGQNIEPADKPSSRSSALIYSVIAVALIAVIAGVLISRGDSTGSEPLLKEVETSKPQATADDGSDRELAPNISGPDVTDPSKTVSLEDFRGKPVVVQVWASWCPICNEEAPDIAAFQKDNPDVAFVGVNVEDTQSEALAYKQRHGLAHESDIADPDREVEGQLGLTGQPNSVLIDEQGRIVQIFPGAVAKEQLEEALKKI